MINRGRKCKTFTDKGKSHKKAEFMNSDRQAKSQTDRKTDRHQNRQNDIQTDRQTYNDKLRQKE